TVVAAIVILGDDILLAGLEELGLRVESRGIDAQYIAVPRLEMERIFVVTRTGRADAAVRIAVLDPPVCGPGDGHAGLKRRQSGDARRIGAAALGGEAEHAERI